jgi:hypothetical protein
MRYFFGFLIAIGLIVLVFFLVLRGFSGSSTPKNQTQLTDYANTNTVMSLTIDGPTSADQTHESINITVGESETVINIMQGYQGSVTSSKTYGNNSTSYGQFLSALQVAGFQKGNTDPTKRDERGFCPTGNRYIYQIEQGNSNSERFWSTSCGSGGTFKGSASIVRQLFIKQVPDYDQLTAGLDMTTN